MFYPLVLENKTSNNKVHPVTSRQLLAWQQTFFFTSLATAENLQLAEAAIIQQASRDQGCQIYSKT